MCDGLATSAGIVGEDRCRKTLETLTVLGFIESAHDTTFKSYGPDYTRPEVGVFKWKPTRSGLEALRQDHPRLIVLTTLKLSKTGDAERSVPRTEVFELLRIDNDVGDSIVNQLIEEGSLEPLFGNSLIVTPKGTSKARNPLASDELHGEMTRVNATGRNINVMVNSPQGNQAISEQAISSEQLTLLVEYLSGSGRKMQLLEDKEKELEEAVASQNPESCVSKEARFHTMK